MDSRHDRTFLPVAQAKKALQSLGVQDATLDQRGVESRSWFADWDGRLTDSDVYIGIMGGSPEGESVRVLLDDWTFDGVAAGEVGEFLTQIFSGRASIRKQKSFLVFSSHVLEVSVGSTSYSAGRDFRPNDELAPWERRLISE